ncbi:MAG: phage tail tape measure protein [Bacteroidales bacterium]|jgi:TP901 family phage tail tape measure protein|nr:phage tail tape measure protein [Bacteroidales bacterium]
MSTNEKANVHVDIEGKQAGQQLEKLQTEAKALKKELIAIKKTGKPVDPKYYDKLKTKLRSTNREMKQYKKQLADVNNVVKNLASSSQNQLLQAKKRLTKEIRNNTRVSKAERIELALKQKQLGLINAELTKFSVINKTAGSSFSNFANGFNKYMMLASAAAATIAGLIMGFRKIIDIANEFEERVDYLSSLTGLIGPELDWLSNKARETSISTVENGIRIRSAAKDIVDAYTLMGSARPELLKNKEDLAEVTEKALILAEAAKMEAAPAIEALAAAMNQFQLPASEASRIINTFAAGSLAGSAEVDHITESLAKAGTVAAASNMTLDETVAVFETLAERQLKGAEAGTQFRSSLLSLKAAGMGYTSGAFNMRDAIVELKASMDSKNTAQEKENVLLDVFGKRNITVGTILAYNIERYDEFTKAVTGTNTAFDQAAINTDNNATKLAQAMNRYSLLAIELGTKVAPALTFSTNSFSYLMKAIMGGIKIFEEYGDVIKSITTGLLAYGVAVKAELILTKLFTAAQWLATTAIKAFNAAAKLNPYTFLAGAIAFVIAKLILFDSSADNASKALTRLSDVIDDFENKNSNAKLALIEQFREGKLTTDEYLDAVEALNKKLDDFYLLNKKIAEGESVYSKLMKDDKDFSKWVKEKGALADVSKVVAFLKQNIANLDSQIADLNGSDSQYMKDILTETRKKQDADLKSIQLAMDAKNKINEENEDIKVPKYSEAWKQEGEDTLMYLERLQKQIDERLKKYGGEEVSFLPDDEEQIADEADYLIEQYKKTFKGRRAILEQELKLGIISRAEYNDKTKVLVAEEVEFEQEGVDLQNASLQAKLEFAIAVAYKIASVMQSISDAATQNDQNELNSYKDTQDKKKKLLEDQLNNGAISREAYDAQMDALDRKVEKKEREMANKKAKRDKEMALFKGIIGVAEAVIKALTAGPLLGQILAAMIAAAGAVQVGIIAGTKVPQYATGNNLEIFGQDDGKLYNAKKGNYGTQLVNGPTFIPGLGLTGEGQKPKELVFSGEDTQRILNAPALIDAINSTLRAPQFANGNYPTTATNTITEKTFTDPALIKGLKDFTDVMTEIKKSGLSVPWNLIDEKNTKMKNLTESVRIK